MQPLPTRRLPAAGPATHSRTPIANAAAQPGTSSPPLCTHIPLHWPFVWFVCAESSRLFLFYSESRKAFSPGGDIKYITSSNAGQTWSPPVTIYTHEADDEVPKVTANKPIVASDGNWYLPGGGGGSPAEVAVPEGGTWVCRRPGQALTGMWRGIWSS